jgi:uncharacterized membrane protein
MESCRLAAFLILPMANKYFSKEEEARVVSAIQAAELATSGEIRVHVEPSTKMDPIDRAKEVFFNLGMHQTELKNGVLIYLAIKDRKMAIIGDAGIHDKVGDNFWQAEKDLMKDYFSKGDYATGLSFAIEHVGIKLKIFFPYQESDTNELSNEISFGADTHE